MHSDDVDWYQFSLDSAGYISLNFEHEYFPDASNHWTSHLYDSNMKELVGYNYAGSSVSSTEAHIGLPAGNYYLKISVYDYWRYYDGRDYSVKINYTPSAVWETEFNDGTSSADPIALNTVYYGGLRNKGDVDWYRFTLEADGEQVLQFEHGYISTTDIDWRLTLYDSAMNKRASLSYAGNITSNIDRYRLSAGNYYINYK